MNFTRLPEISCLLVDNGSLSPAATLNLRKIAVKLEAAIEHPVRPVSLLHSDRVSSADLGGTPAETLESSMRAAIDQGARKFIVLPFFFGPSAALTEFIPERVAEIGKSSPDLDVRIASPLVRLDQPEDTRIAAILADNAHSTVAAANLANPPVVVVVDHGSPQSTVADVRNHVAEQVARQLGSAAQVVLPASMERRPGPEYDFNEPLLEHALRRLPCGCGDVVVSMMFLSPGRHAGAGGDVEQICRSAEECCPGLKIHITPLAGDHPLIVEILADRFREVTAQ